MEVKPIVSHDFLVSKAAIFPYFQPKTFILLRITLF